MGAPPTPGVTARGRQRRVAILETAVGLACKEGLAALSLGRLASAVQMSKSGIYAHFGSKESLQLATVEHAWEVFAHEVLRRPGHLGASGPEGTRGLEALLERWLSFYERRVLPGSCLFLGEVIQFEFRPGPVREALVSAVTEQVEALRTAVQHAQETGELSGEKDASQAAFELHSLLINADALFALTGDRAVFEYPRARISEFLGAAAS
jgi:AcrR family transcriptional regulator